MKKNKELYITTLLLTIWNIILFFGQRLGLSVILFNIPTVILIVYILKKENKINNKYGLLFMVPIIVLSLSFLLYTSIVTLICNFFAIIIFYVLLLIYTVNKTYEIPSIFENAMNIIFLPFEKIEPLYKQIFSHNKEKTTKKKLSEETKNKIISIIIIIPIIILVIALLSSADIIFKNLFQGFFDFMNHLKEIIQNIKISELAWKIIFRGIYLIIFFTYFTASMLYIKYTYDKKENIGKEKKHSTLTIKPLLFTLNIIYIIFDFIQIRSLIFHKVSMDITYAEYARQGFFQLMFVSFINMIIILITKKFNEKDKKFNQIMSVIMILLTSIIVISSFLRMNMYEQAYGYTVLRLIVYVVLITELILMVPTIIYCIKDNFNVTKYYLIICSIIYTIIGILPLNYIIATRNIDKYYKDHKIDIEYLCNNDYDNIPELLKLYNQTNDVELKLRLNNYFYHFYETNQEKIKEDMNYFSEWNLSKYKAIKQLKKESTSFNEYQNNTLIDSSYLTENHITKELYPGYMITYEAYYYDNNVYQNKDGYTLYDGREEIKEIPFELEMNNIQITNVLTDSDITNDDYYYYIENDFIEYDLYYFDVQKNILHVIHKYKED